MEDINGFLIQEQISGMQVFWLEAQDTIIYLSPEKHPSSDSN